VQQNWDGAICISCVTVLKRDKLETELVYFVHKNQIHVTQQEQNVMKDTQKYQFGMYSR
jgi:hypothetical protein